MSKTKNFNLEEILINAKEIKKQGKKVVVVYGHFNVIHPGHLRFLNFSKQLGDYLIVSIENPNQIAPNYRNNFFLQKDRANSVSALEMVNAVYQLPGSVVDFIDKIKPDIYVKGREFEQNPELIEEEIKAVERNGGEIKFSSGEVEYSSSSFATLNNNGSHNKDNKKEEFLNICGKHYIDIEKIIASIHKFSKLKILIIGDTIVDQFIACDVLGISSEAPVMAIRELKSKTYTGGSAIIAGHLHSLGSEAYYISVVGDDESGKEVCQKLNEQKINTYILTDDTRPTTFKIRYMVDNQKVLRVSRLKQHQISSKLEDKIIRKLHAVIPEMDGIIISDFVYGVISPKIFQTIKEVAKISKTKIFGDLQCSSQIGDVSKFTNINLITPTEKEARVAMRDHTSGLEKLALNLLKKTSNEHLVITLGASGLLVYGHSSSDSHIISEYFPALSKNPIDVSGAGDSLLSAYALGLCAGLNILESSALGSCLAAISVMRVGNIPITIKECVTYLENVASYRWHLNWDNSCQATLLPH